jgi:ribosomal protein L13E
MWSKRDWKAYYGVARNGRSRMRPPRPVFMTDAKRLAPTEGFSLKELDDAGISLEHAENLGLPIDMGRSFAVGQNVEALRGCLIASRDRSN